MAAVVLQVRDGRVQRMPQPLFVIGKIADRRTLVHGACGANRTGLFQQGFDQGRLAGSGVSDDGEVANLFSSV